MKCGVGSALKQPGDAEESLLGAFASGSHGHSVRKNLTEKGQAALQVVVAGAPVGYCESEVEIGGWG